MQRGWMVRGGWFKSTYGRETQDEEVQRWVYELEVQLEQRQLFSEGDMGQGDRRTKGHGRGHNFTRKQRESERVKRAWVKGAQISVFK